MGERKVLNKYFPPDFDPSLVPRRKRPKNEQIEVRMMLPFSIQCDTCGEYMYRGKKFNSRKEDVVEETYHGIRIFRFYIKCITCSSEITFKTDPKRGDYVAEHGCQRNFEPWRETEDQEEAALKQKEEEESGDAMKALENRTLDSKREMDILDALDEIKAINQRHAKIDTDQLLQQHAHVDDLSELDAQRQLEEDQALAKQVFQQKQQQQSSRKRPVGESKPSSDKATDVQAATDSKPTTSLSSSALEPTSKTPSAAAPPALANVVIKKKTAAAAGKKPVVKKKKAPQPALTSLVAQYSDSSGDD